MISGRRRAVTCRSRSGKRSRCYGRRTWACGRSPGVRARPRRRSRGSSAATRRPGRQLEYRASVAQWKAERRAAPEESETGRERSAAGVRAGPAVRRRPPPDGTVARATTPRGRGGTSLSGRIAGGRGLEPGADLHRLKVDFPDDDSMRISHEAIYQALFIQGRGALKRELVACLRTGRALRVPRARSRNSRGHVTPEVMISQRPAEAEDRAVPGHWEGDLIIGTGRSAIGTLVERTTRFTMLVHLPRMDGYGRTASEERPGAGGYGAEAMKDALAAKMTTLPEQLRRSLTWDRGKELPARPAQNRYRHHRSTSPTRTALAAAPTRTPTVCCASTSPKAPTFAMERRGPRSRRPRAQQPTPQDPRLEDTRRGPQRTATLDSNRPVLRRPVEPAQYTSGLHRACRKAGVRSPWARSAVARTTRSPSPSTPPSNARPSRAERAGPTSARPASSFPLAAPLQHSAPPFPPRTAQPDRLRDSIHNSTNYAGNSRITRVQDSGSRPGCLTETGLTIRSA